VNPLSSPLSFGQTQKTPQLVSHTFKANLDDGVKSTTVVKSMNKQLIQPNLPLTHIKATLREVSQVSFKAK
jgi:hypothetical protein